LRSRGSFISWATYTTAQLFTVEYPQGDKGGNEICARVTQAGQPMDLHRFWDSVFTSSSNLTRLRNEAAALPNRQEFQRSQLTELEDPSYTSASIEFKEDIIHDMSPEQRQQAIEKIEV
jgi:hypothetical protein